MVLKAFSLAAFCLQSTATAVRALQSQVNLLRLSALASRGYLPESEEITMRRVSEGLHTMPVFSANLKEALIARTQAAYTVIRLMFPVLKIHGELQEVAQVLERVREANPIMKRARNPMRADLTNALTRLGEGVNAIFKTLTAIHAQLPDWRGVCTARRDFFRSLKSLSRALRELCQFPSLEAARVAFEQVSSSWLFDTLNPFQAHTSTVTDAQIKASSLVDVEWLYRAIRNYNQSNNLSQIWYLFWRLHLKRFIDFLEVLRDSKKMDFSRRFPKVMSLCKKLDVLVWLGDLVNEVLPAEAVLPMVVTTYSAAETLRKLNTLAMRGRDTMVSAKHEAHESLRHVSIYSLDPESPAITSALQKVAEAISMCVSCEATHDKYYRWIDKIHAASLRKSPGGVNI
jgi:hypothetical protein